MKLGQSLHPPRRCSPAHSTEKIDLNRLPCEYSLDRTIVLIHCDQHPYKLRMIQIRKGIVESLRLMDLSKDRFIFRSIFSNHFLIGGVEERR